MNLPYPKINVRARIPSIFITRNLQVVGTWRTADTATHKNHRTRHVYNAAPATQIDDKMRLPRKVQCIFRKRCKSISACDTKRLLTRDETPLSVTKCHACHAKRSYNACDTSKTLLGTILTTFARPNARTDCELVNLLQPKLVFSSISRK